KKYFNESSVIFIATGLNFPDALCAGPIAAKMNQSTLVLTRKDTVPEPIGSYLKTKNHQNIYLIGGTGVITDLQRSILENI
ncbi:MAG: cell wall-binding repeat-containing protein, partial [Actinomycetia bacterium]|nr:cell wall-binding repeat-containing protein [Actinomycetes bacterium]